MNSVLKHHPTVCPIGDSYQIMVVTWCNALLSVRVGDKVYYNNRGKSITTGLKGITKYQIAYTSNFQEDIDG